MEEGVWFELNCLSIYSSFWKKVYHNFHANCTFNPVATILCPKLLLILKEKSHTLNNCVKNWSSDSIFGLSRSKDTSIDNTTQRDLLNHIENNVSTRKIGISIPPHFNIKWYLFFQKMNIRSTWSIKIISVLNDSIMWPFMAFL